MLDANFKDIKNNTTYTKADLNRIFQVLFYKPADYKKLQDLKKYFNTSLQENITVKNRMSANDFKLKIAESNKENGTNFSLSGSYNQNDLWAKKKNTDGTIGDYRIESGSLKDCYNAWVKYRFIEEFIINN
jgi:hypothetical protein